MRRRNLTSEELDDAKRLKKVWEDRKDELNLTQVSAAKELGYNSQGSVSQYLNGTVPLNMITVAKFAKLLRVKVEDISPRYVHLFPSGGDGSQIEYRTPRTDPLQGDDGLPRSTLLGLSDAFLEAFGTTHLNVWELEWSQPPTLGVGHGEMLIVSDKFEVTNGLYLIMANRKHELRQVTINDSEVIIEGGSKPITLPIDSIAMINLSAKVLLVVRGT